MSAKYSFRPVTIGCWRATFKPKSWQFFKAASSASVVWVSNSQRIWFINDLVNFMYSVAESNRLMPKAFNPLVPIRLARYTLQVARLFRAVIGLKPFTSIFASHRHTHTTFNCGGTGNRTPFYGLCEHWDKYNGIELILCPHFRSALYIFFCVGYEHRTTML